MVSLRNMERLEIFTSLETRAKGAIEDLGLFASTTRKTLTRPWKRMERLSMEKLFKWGWQKCVLLEESFLCWVRITHRYRSPSYDRYRRSYSRGRSRSHGHRRYHSRSRSHHRRSRSRSYDRSYHSSSRRDRSSHREPSHSASRSRSDSRRRSTSRD